MTTRVVRKPLYAMPCSSVAFDRCFISSSAGKALYGALSMWAGEATHAWTSLGNLEQAQRRPSMRFLRFHGDLGSWPTDNGHSPFASVAFVGVKRRGVS